MKISEHAERTRQLFGTRAEDIHKWIDGFFDHESFGEFMQSGNALNYDPYEHRKFRHCKEALEEAYQEFEGKYSRKLIKDIFECHLKDDYNGYLPNRDDFKNGTFTEKYHEGEEKSAREHILSEMELAEYFKGKEYYHKQKQNSKKPLTSFHLKIVLPTLAATALFIISIFTLIMPVFQNKMLQDRKVMIKELTLAAESVIEHYVELHEKGELSLEQAQKFAADEISDMRYGPELKDYFWITDMHPTMIMHPYLPELNGKDLTDYVDIKDKSKKKLFVEFVNIVKTNNGEGYLKYLWQWKDDEAHHVPKLSYVRLVPEWQWIVGTGIYVHDVEAEIQGLTYDLLWVFLIISIILFAIILYVISQSHKIENERIRAERGLIEAKDRYRALVEASNEGYILLVDGENIYSNITLQRMTGYSEQELSEITIWKEMLPENSRANQNAIRQIEKIIAGDISAAEFEAQLLTKTGIKTDVIMAASKIFLSEKNGHVISVRKITRTNIASDGKLYEQIQNYSELPAGIQLEIESGDTIGHIVNSLSNVPVMVREMTLHGVKSTAIRDSLCTIFETTMVRLIKMAIEELGEPPTEFAFLLLGSNARREMTMFSDQDNAIIIKDSDGDITTIKRYYLKLADRVCTMLDRAGYKFCPGGIMAINPRWCMTLSEWKDKFTHKTIQKFDESVLDIHTFFDINCIYGSDALKDELHSHMMEITRENPEFFLHMARNCLSYNIPINAFGFLKGETQDGVKSINLKDCLVPIVNFARIFALKYNINAPATLNRLKSLAKQDIISSESLEDMTLVFDHLWYLRFYNQIICHADLREVNDELELDKLTAAECQKLRDSLNTVSAIQNKLSYEFLGIAAN